MLTDNSYRSRLADISRGMKTCDESIIFAFGRSRVRRGAGFSSEIGRPARFGDRKSGKSSVRHAQHVTTRSASRSCPIKHTSKYRFLSGSIWPRHSHDYSCVRYCFLVARSPLLLSIILAVKFGNAKVKKI